MVARAKLDNVLLGLVRIHDGATGYELKSIIGASTGYFFKASFSQIYPSLARLTAEGSVTFVESDSSGRKTKNYSITPSGIVSLQAWLEEPIEYEFTEEAIWELLLKMVFMGGENSDRTLEVLRHAKAHFEAEYKDILDRHLVIEDDFIDRDTKNREVYLSIWECEYDYIVQEAKNKVEWIDRCIKTVKRLKASRPI